MNMRTLLALCCSCLLSTPLMALDAEGTRQLQHLQQRWAQINYQLPEAQREPMLALLRQLDARQLGQLGLLSQRTPPQEREALREQLLAAPASARGEWLQRRLGE